MRWIIVIIFTLSCLLVRAQRPELRRICPSGLDNNLYWSNPIYPCNNFLFYIIWERKGSTGTYAPIDTIYSLNTETYTHENANPPLSEPNSNYIIERRDSCGGINSTFSDTVKVDIEPPNISELDSVSIDINTNKVVLGWRTNTSPDFDKYLLYVLENGFFVAMNPSETRDTFATDNGARNPQNGSFTYTINTRDSCGRLPAFEKRHTTIFLQHTIDTCKREYRLQWSHYVGWLAIRKYYIYKRINSGVYNLIDSVVGTQNNYVGNFNSGENVSIFVRAQKDTSIFITSSSNTVSFFTRNRIDPKSAYFEYITTGTPSNNLLFGKVNIRSNEEASKYIVRIKNTISGDINEAEYTPLEINSELAFGLPNNQRYLFTVLSYDLCGNLSHTSDSSTNIFLEGRISNNTQKSLWWNPYFTWNNGTEKYITYRGSGDNGSFSLVFWENNSDTSTTDAESITPQGNEGECYYIEAIENISGITSKSNIYCFPPDFTVFLPNAFVPKGENKIFKPKGNLIDEQKSTMRIINRWGITVYENNLVEGWDGTDKNSVICPSDVYYYQVEIISKDNQIRKYAGTVSLLR